ncbi:lipid kinase YegS [Shewanella litoralis]|uniref:Probable lipid kinase YegS-like n=1 Tax=Shewanella litoralis TaxID=2282700 RepID=A0ABQ2RD94_9GAMM|nr:lipid kinase YegS [Shewanella litoralis]GGQ23314.1 putative lipid kinase YegS-like protein [Shewanella litoralis]
MQASHIRLILNGKKAAIAEIRQTVMLLRDEGYIIDVRVTWEHADMQRFIDEAINDNVARIVVGGGDGTLNEAVTALQLTEAPANNIALALLPLGTANDFASACHIPVHILSALRLAITGNAFYVDVINATNLDDNHTTPQYFINAAVAGFGAQVTAETPSELKDFLGGGAYTLTGLAKALGFKPYQGSITTVKGRFEGEIVVGAMCNGRQAGGGQLLAPKAYIDDGLMDVTLLKSFSPLDIPTVIEEISTLSGEAKFCYHFQTRWLEIDFPIELPLNLDGEPYPSKQMRFEVVPHALRMVLPDDCPCLSAKTTS